MSHLTPEAKRSILQQRANALLADVDAVPERLDQRADQETRHRDAIQATLLVAQAVTLLAEAHLHPPT